MPVIVDYEESVVITPVLRFQDDDALYYELVSAKLTEGAQ